MRPISRSPLRHTYPSGRHDMEVDHSDAATMRTEITSIFADHHQCRRVIVAVEQGNGAQIAECEAAGLHYVLDIQLRTLEEVSLMVAELNWVAAQTSDIHDLELT
ncbi:hypothetical protein ABMV07_11825 [Corynebacterium belfantii]|uniref:hypothetical protein n=1 Tax=Corynebacterium belfantii TaxID=2014537 RepID=UPI0009600C69|nr:hypothetical protein [Corynebacterium belfantii]MBG9310686.1 hypothetical protein [Corynebacterium belfantii]OLN15339.1 hypothetical protein BUE64_08000 [Corynebacterium diphtheriae subsp. lausannense]QBZ29570.1 hypothetical protein E4653_06515 [Corynebacterium diphtheriae subsp. lausannense]